jgi:uncharacterized protein YecT (DUF1311 family)
VVHIVLALILGFVAAGVGSALADELDGWCAQVKKASSIVICSNLELREQAISRNKIFETARQKLSGVDYKALTEDQTRWVKSYTAKCGVSLNRPLLSPPIPQNIIECYRRESRARTAYLEERLSEASKAAAPPAATVGNPGPNPFDQFDKTPVDPPAESRERVNDALVEAGIPRAQVEAMTAWHDCTEAAVDKFADQPESARTVAEAAMAICTDEEYSLSELGA